MSSYTSVSTDKLSRLIGTPPTLIDVHLDGRAVCVIQIALTTVLLIGVAMFASADAGHAAFAEQETVVARTQGEAGVRPPATESLRGVIDSVDQSSGTITIRLSRDKTEQFRVQDGLIFDAVRFGDLVEVSVQTIAGAKTIVGLAKQ